MDGNLLRGGYLLPDLDDPDDSPQAPEVTHWPDPQPTDIPQSTGCGLSNLSVTSFSTTRHAGNARLGTGELHVEIRSTHDIIPTNVQHSHQLDSLNYGNMMYNQPILMASIPQMQAQTSVFPQHIQQQQQQELLLPTNQSIHVPSHPADIPACPQMLPRERNDSITMELHHDEDYKMLLMNQMGQRVGGPLVFPTHSLTHAASAPAAVDLSVSSIHAASINVAVDSMNSRNAQPTVNSKAQPLYSMLESPAQTISSSVALKDELSMHKLKAEDHSDSLVLVVTEPFKGSHGFNFSGPKGGTIILLDNDKKLLKKFGTWVDKDESMEHDAWRLSRVKDIPPKGTSSGGDANWEKIKVKGGGEMLEEKGVYLVVIRFPARCNLLGPKVKKWKRSRSPKDAAASDQDPAAPLPMEQLELAMERCSHLSDKHHIRNACDRVLEQIVHGASDLDIGMQLAHVPGGLAYSELVDCYKRGPLHLAVTPTITEWPPDRDVKHPVEPIPLLERQVLVRWLLCQRHELMYSKNNNGATPLLTAASFADEANLPLFSLLLDASDLRVLTMESNSGWLAMHRLVQCGHKAALELLLKRTQDLVIQHCQMELGPDRADRADRADRKMGLMAPDRAEDLSKESLATHVCGGVGGEEEGQAKVCRGQEAGGGETKGVQDILQCRVAAALKGLVVHINNKHYNPKASTGILEEVCARLGIPQPAAVAGIAVAPA